MSVRDIISFFYPEPKSRLGYQFFGFDGKGFLHDGTAIKLPNGKKQFFLYDGTAIFHDG